MRVPGSNRTTRNLAIFIGLVLGIASLAGYIEPFTIPPGADPGASGLGQLLWIMAPLVIVLFLRSLGGDGWDDFGLRPNISGNGLWWMVSVFIFPVVITITMIIGVLLGGLELAFSQLSALIAALVAGLAAAVLKNVFEEFAWRGYLAPKVYSLNWNIWVSHALVGIVWGAWHLPFIYFLWSYLTPDMLWYFVPLLLIGTISQSVVYGEIRLATHSVIPAWIMHTLGNALGNALLVSGFLQLKPGWEWLITPGAEGVVSIFLMFVVGFWLHHRRKNSGVM